MSLAPIVLFVYNRPDHTLRTLEALSGNVLADQSQLFIFADGPKAGASAEVLEKIKRTREAVKSRKWCGSQTIFESEENRGLAASVIAGVTKIVKEHGQVIVLEDDLITSPHFLQYMNDALTMYKNEDAVACVSAYIYPVKESLPETFFVKGADCWGWATWDRAWKNFEADGSRLLKKLPGREKEFDFDNTYPFTEMLEHQIAGKNDSWAIRWYASAFLENRLCLYPGKSLVNNIGFDGSGTHSGSTAAWEANMTQGRVDVKKLPVKEDEASKKKIAAYFRSLKPSLVKRMKEKLKGMLYKN